MLDQSVLGLINLHVTDKTTMHTAESNQRMT